MKTLISVHSTTSASPIDRPRLNSQPPWIWKDWSANRSPDEPREGVERTDRPEDRVQDHHRADDHRHHAQVEQERDLQHRPRADLAEHDLGLTGPGGRGALRSAPLACGMEPRGRGSGGRRWPDRRDRSRVRALLRGGRPGGNHVGSPRRSEHQPRVHGPDHAEHDDGEHPRRRTDVLLHEETADRHADPPDRRERVRGPAGIRCHRTKTVSRPSALAPTIIATPAPVDTMGLSIETTLVDPTTRSSTTCGSSWRSSPSARSATASPAWSWGAALADGGLSDGQVGLVFAAILAGNAPGLDRDRPRRRPTSGRRRAYVLLLLGDERRRGRVRALRFGDACWCSSLSPAPCRPTRTSRGRSPRSSRR